LSLTLFAPLNSAFMALPDDYLEVLTDEQVTFVLRYHAVSGEEIFEGDLVCSPDVGSVIPMVNGQNTETFCDDGDVFQVGEGNTEPNYPQIVRADIAACNGVIHVINNVIRPAFASPADADADAP
jgi:transforming growth factor-beta-induced protein